MIATSVSAACQKLNTYISDSLEVPHHIWQHLMRVAARGSVATDADLSRMIKDAVDNGVSVDFEEVDEEGEAHVVKRLQEAVYAAHEWAKLKTAVKKHKQK